MPAEAGQAQHIHPSAEQRQRRGPAVVKRQAIDQQLVSMSAMSVMVSRSVMSHPQKEATQPKLPSTPKAGR